LSQSSLASAGATTLRVPAEKTVVPSSPGRTVISFAFANTLSTLST
jgi:hypothetical protein